MIELRPDLPKWQQIVKVIRTRIETGELSPSSMITERGLMEEFEVAGGTARKAIKALRSAGLIYTRVNLGSFVGPEPDDE